jgi:hypothetical protein
MGKITSRTEKVRVEEIVYMHMCVYIGWSGNIFENRLKQNVSMMLK